MDRVMVDVWTEFPQGLQEPRFRGLVLCGSRKASLAEWVFELSFKRRKRVSQMKRVTEGREEQTARQVWPKA